jgi:hypothetical protein
MVESHTMLYGKPSLLCVCGSSLAWSVSVSRELMSAGVL